MDDGSPAEDSKDALDMSEFCNARFDPEDIDFNDDEEQMEIARLYDGLESESSADEDEEGSNSESGSDKAGEKATRQAAGNCVRFCDFGFPNFGEENTLHSSFFFCYKTRSKVMKESRYPTPTANHYQNQNTQINRNVHPKFIIYQ